MVDIHDRRAVVLTPDLAREWLEPAEAFEWFKVGTAAGNVRNKGPDLIKPA